MNSEELATLIAERDDLEQRVAFLVAEAHGWQPKLQAAVEERDEVLGELAYVYECERRRRKSRWAEVPDEIRDEWIVAGRDQRTPRALAKEPS